MKRERSSYAKRTSSLTGAQPIMPNLYFRNLKYYKQLSWLTNFNT